MSRDTHIAPRPSSSYPIIAAALVVATTSIGFAIYQHGGEYTPLAIALVGLAIVATLIGVIFSKHESSSVDTRWIVPTMGVAVMMQLAALIILWPVGMDQSADTIGLRNHVLYVYLLGASVLLLLIGLIGVPSMRKWWFPALLLLHALVGIWSVRSSPLPHIDVWYFQEQAARALLDGKNPYDAAQVQFPDIYLSTHDGHQRVYGEDMVKDDHLLFGFPYPPLSLYCATIGYLVANDVRYSQAIAITLAGLLIGYVRPGLLPKFAAALLMFTPTVWFVLGRAWIEPFVVLFFAATIFCAARRLRWVLPVAFGLFLASKQYLALAVPMSFLLIDDFTWLDKKSCRRWLILLMGALAAAAVVTLPLALRDPHAFWFSTITVQKESPFRWDSLSFLVWAGFHLGSGYTHWTWIAFAAAAAAMLITAWKAHRSPFGFALAMALVYLVFFAFNKQAFCNYYFFVIGCLCCAIASTDAKSLRDIAESFQQPDSLDRTLINAPHIPKDIGLLSNSPSSE